MGEYLAPLASPENIFSSVMPVTLSMFRRDVVPGNPFWFVGNAVEMLLNDLLSPGESVAPAHEGDYGR
jgi:hypothetical protein